SGFLVPRVDGRLMTACTWKESKWAHLAGAAGDPLLLRASTGRAGDERFAALDDGALVAALHGELVEAMGIAEPPREWRVDRWPSGFPQYNVGHLARVGRIEAALAAAPMAVAVAGAAYRGVGIAGCIRQGEHAARGVLDRL